MRRRALMRAMLGAVALVGAAVTTGCGSGESAGGDPGNRRLQQLASDPVFALLPPGATRTGLEQQSAVYRKGNLFQGPSWDGPAVILRFQSSQPTADVYRFFVERAEANGWTADKKDYLGDTDQWSKTYPDTKANAIIDLLPDSRDTVLPRAYTMRGSISAARG